MKGYDTMPICCIFHCLFTNYDLIVHVVWDSKIKKYGTCIYNLYNLGTLAFLRILSFTWPTWFQSFPDEALSEYRLQGRHFFTNYLGSTQSVLDTVLATLRTRLQIPATPPADQPSPSAFPHGFVPKKWVQPGPTTISASKCLQFCANLQKMCIHFYS